MLSIKKIFNTYIPAIGWFFLVLYFICMAPSNIPPVDDWISKLYPDKWVHAILFGGLVFLFSYPLLNQPLTQKQKNNGFLKVLLATIIWGLTTEFIQKYFIPGRFFDLYDWAADSFGAICANLFCKKLLNKRITAK